MISPPLIPSIPLKLPSAIARFTSATRALSTYLDGLSTWYLRLSRDRMRRSADDDHVDRDAAFGKRDRRLQHVGEGQRAEFFERRSQSLHVAGDRDRQRPPQGLQAGLDLAEHGDRIAVGLDVRGRTLAARGWTREGGDLYDVLARLDSEGCARYVVTDVNKDGMLQGPNLELLRNVCAATDRPVVASGGVTELTDLEALAGLVDEGVEGAIIGTALYEGRFSLEDALALTLPASRA